MSAINLEYRNEIVFLLHFFKHARTFFNQLWRYDLDVFDASPYMENSDKTLGMLGLFVVIRTFLHVFIELEVSGHWPWEVAAGKADTSNGSMPTNLNAPSADKYHSKGDINNHRVNRGAGRNGKRP
jgi:hypothetical protein